MFILSSVHITYGVTKNPDDVLFFIATFLHESLDSCWEKRRVLVVGIYKSIARMILAQKSSPVPSSRRSSLAPLPRRGCLVLPVPRRSSEPSPAPAPRSRSEPPPALGRVEQLDLIHRLSIETKFQFQFKRESRVQGPQLILNIQNPPGTGVEVLMFVCLFVCPSVRLSVCSVQTCLVGA